MGGEVIASRCRGKIKTDRHGPRLRAVPPFVPARSARRRFNEPGVAGSARARLDPRHHIRRLLTPDQSVRVAASGDGVAHQRGVVAVRVIHVEGLAGRRLGPRVRRHRQGRGRGGAASRPAVAMAANAMLRMRCNMSDPSVRRSCVSQRRIWRRVRFDGDPMGASPVTGTWSPSFVLLSDTRTPIRAAADEPIAPASQRIEWIAVRSWTRSAACCAMRRELGEPSPYRHLLLPPPPC